MKRLIIIPIIFITISTKSGIHDTKLSDLRKDIELIDNTITWVKSSDIRRDMAARKNKLIKDYLSNVK